MSSYSNVKITFGWNQRTWRKTNKQTNSFALLHPGGKTQISSMKDSLGYFWLPVVQVVHNSSAGQWLQNCYSQRMFVRWSAGITVQNLPLESFCIAAEFYCTSSFFLQLHNICCPLFSSSQIPYLLLKMTSEPSADCYLLLLAPSGCLATLIGKQIP